MTNDDDVDREIDQWPADLVGRAAERAKRLGDARAERRRLKRADERALEVMRAARRRAHDRTRGGVF